MTWHILVILSITGLISTKTDGQTQWSGSEYPDPRTDPNMCNMKKVSKLCDPDGLLEDKWALEIGEKLEKQEQKLKSMRIHYTDNVADCRKDSGVRIFVILAKQIDKLERNKTADIDLIRFGNLLSINYHLSNVECRNFVILIGVEAPKLVYFKTGFHLKLPVDATNRVFNHYSSFFDTKNYGQGLNRIIDDIGELMIDPFKLTTTRQTTKKTSSTTGEAIINISIFTTEETTRNTMPITTGETTRNTSAITAGETIINMSIFTTGETTRNTMAITTGETTRNISAITTGETTRNTSAITTGEIETSKNAIKFIVGEEINTDLRLISPEQILENKYGNPNKIDWNMLPWWFPLLILLLVIIIISLIIVFSITRRKNRKIYTKSMRINRTEVKREMKVEISGKRENMVKNDRINVDDTISLDEKIVPAEISPTTPTKVATKVQTNTKEWQNNDIEFVF